VARTIRVDNLLLQAASLLRAQRGREWLILNNDNNNNNNNNNSSIYDDINRTQVTEYN